MQLTLVMMIATMLVALTIPMSAGADDQRWMPPEWTSTAPARPTVDLVRFPVGPVARGERAGQ
jgi:hypothetical protein